MPEFGTGVVYAILICAAYTFAVSLAAGRGHPRLLQSARMGAYATSATRYIVKKTSRSASLGFLAEASPVDVDPRAATATRTTAPRTPTAVSRALRVRALGST